MRDELSPVERMSLAAAVGGELQRHIEGGAVVKAGQFGQTVIQYPDHHYLGSGLGWVRNPGEWAPGPVHDEPPHRRPLEGEALCGSDGMTRWVGAKGRWWCVRTGEMHDAG